MYPHFPPPPRLRLYLLDGHTPVLCDNVIEWSARMVDIVRVASYEDEGVWVSTVFLGIDFCFDDGPPPMFETMVFYGGTPRIKQRYHTWEEAEAGHARAVEAVMAVQNLTYMDGAKALRRRLLRLPKAKRG